jgi:hypothetical protein
MKPKTPSGSSRIPPLSGHDLMAIFPAAAPVVELSPSARESGSPHGSHSASGIFQKQERAYFARANPLGSPEQVRRPKDASSFSPHPSSAHSPVPRTSPLAQSDSSFHSSPSSRGASTATAASPSGPGPLGTDASSPGSASASGPNSSSRRHHGQHHHQPPRGYEQLALPPPPLVAPGTALYPQGYQPPPPPPEIKRRAGKHTRRVIAKP